MSDVIIGAVIGVAGTIIGVLISFFLEIWKSKKEKERVTLELKINTYAEAIRYISICSKMAIYENMPGTSSDGYIKDLMLEENRLYNHFHPIFTIIAPKDKVEAFNKLRNDISSKKIPQNEAYEMVVKLLDFNINN